MQIRHIKIKNFRGIADMAWAPRDAFCCLIGAGDSGKSTILDAAEAALNSRWLSFSESDFLSCDTSNTIEIEVTVGELSKALKSDERFGLYIRGWTEAGALRDEPEDGDEPVLTVKLTVDATLEPVWEMVCDRVETPRTISNRDRALFGLVRLAGDDARHLAWGQGSVLSRLTGDNSEAAARLSDAYRAARDSAELDKIKSLSDTAVAAERHAKALGAYVDGTYQPGLELGRSGLSSGSIALHDDGVPLRLAGLGTRRLATLGIQKSAITEGAIILIDEIEHGLEPHRIIGVLSQLKSDQDFAEVMGAPIGQVLMTTHSDIALGETGGKGLHVVSTSRPDRTTMLRSPEAPDPINALMRHTPRAMFARRILVTEGMTEVGMITGIREKWPPRHKGKPIEQLGAAITDGNGSQACVLALALAELGYPTALFRDSDVALTAVDIAALAAAGVPVFEYGGLLNTEQAIFSAASDAAVQELLGYARLQRGDDIVNDNLAAKIPGLDRANASLDFSEWATTFDKSSAALREIISEVMSRKKWFKDQRIGRGLAPHVWSIALASPESPLAKTLAAVEAWLYA
jgi:AAA domain, putative AbiEii toxin, Type IV TA system/AAA ATPase domain